MIDLPSLYDHQIDLRDRTRAAQHGRVIDLTIANDTIMSKKFYHAVRTRPPHSASSCVVARKPFAAGTT